MNVDGVVEHELGGMVWLIINNMLEGIPALMLCETCSVEEVELEALFDMAITAESPLVMAKGTFNSNEPGEKTGKNGIGVDDSANIFSAEGIRTKKKECMERMVLIVTVHCEGR